MGGSQLAVNFTLVIILAAEWFKLNDIVPRALIHKTTYLVVGVVKSYIIVEVHPIDYWLVIGRKGEVVIEPPI